MFKRIAIITAGIIAVFLLVAALLPASYTVERNIRINQTPEVIYAQVADFNNFLLWNPWSSTDPDAKNEISGTSQQPGHKWAWSGTEVGKGYLTLTEVQPHTRILMELGFTEPWVSKAKETWTFEAAAGQTLVTWRDEGELSYPFARYFGLLMDNMLGKDFEKGLNNLKKRCETSN